MKSDGWEDMEFVTESRPARGAWVEIQTGACRSYADLSRPARGAWVEIMDYPNYCKEWEQVAPRKGRVG